MSSLQPPLYAWFQLVDESGTAFQKSKPSRVLLPSGAIIDDFCKAVKAEYADSLLQGIAASTLAVYASKDAFAGNEAALEPDASVDVLGMTKVDALLVVVPAVTAQPTASRQRERPSGIRADDPSLIMQRALYYQSPSLFVSRLDFADNYLPPAVIKYEAKMNASTTKSRGDHLAKKILVPWNGFDAAAGNCQFDIGSEMFQFWQSTEETVGCEADLTMQYVFPNLLRPCIMFFGRRLKTSQAPCDSIAPDVTLSRTDTPNTPVAFIEIKKHQTLSTPTNDHGSLVDWYRASTNATLIGNWPSHIESVIDQVYAYALKSPSRTVMLTTYERTWFFHLAPDQDDVMFVTRAFGRTDTNPTMVRCVLYWLSELLKPTEARQIQTTFPAQQSVHLARSLATLAHDSGGDTSDSTSHAQDTSSSDYVPHKSCSEESASDVLNMPTLDVSDVLGEIGRTRQFPTELLGCGASGATYLYTFKGHRLALKMTDVNNNKRGFEMLQHEVVVYKRLKELQGKCIPKCFGLGTIFGCGILAMSYIDAEPFDAAKHDEEAVKAQVQSIMEAMQDLGVVYRDVRPANTLVEQQTGRVWLIDFGIDKLIE